VTDGPKFQLSSAPQANFVEAINMSLHIFERHQKDRVLDRTGQMILVISAGVGVYDCTHHLPLSSMIGFSQKSDQRSQYRKDLYKKTQHRIRDLGIGPVLKKTRTAGMRSLLYFEFGPCARRPCRKSCVFINTE